LVTGLVFDLPHSPWKAEVLRLRATYEPARLGFPIEITVVGSSGLGWFSPTQSRNTLVCHVREIAKNFRPFTFRFEKVARFPNSNVYYLSPRESAPFHDFQRQLATCGLSFEPTPFTYTPHCTIVIVPGTMDERTDAEIMSCPIPNQEVHVASVSFYTVDLSSQHCHQHERIILGV
jgi:2'-5' RNA ligase